RTSRTSGAPPRPSWRAAPARRRRRSEHGSGTPAGGRATSVAPVEPADLGRAASEIPVAAEGAHARLVGARHRDVRRDPVFGVTDDDGLALVLAGDRRDGAVDDLLDREH